MSSEKKIFWGTVVVILLGVAALVLLPSLETLTAPEPVQAWVAVQPEGAAAARIGAVKLPAGTPFTLHAVLEARTRDGEPLYYTQAPALVARGEPVPDDRLRTWDRPLPVQVLWLTVEGTRPVLQLEPGDSVEERLRWTEYLRSDWPYAWSVPGRLEPAFDDPLATPASTVERPFGTQRYQVRIEIFEEEGDDFPLHRFASAGAAELEGGEGAFPTVTAALPGAAGPASAVFGLPHVLPPAQEADGEARPAARESLRHELVRLTRARLAFATLPLLREVIRAGSGEPGELAWSYVSLDGTVPWQERVRPGDLLRAGGRVVVLYTDAAPGQADAAQPTAGNGVLDRPDLVFDFTRGPAVRALSDVFEGEGGQVEWVPLGRSG